MIKYSNASAHLNGLLLGSPLGGDGAL